MVKWGNELDTLFQDFLCCRFGQLFTPKCVQVNQDPRTTAIFCVVVEKCFAYMRTIIVYVIARSATKMCLDLSQFQLGDGIVVHLCSGRVFIGRAAHPREYVLSYTLGISRMLACLPPARRTDRVCLGTGGSWIGIPPRSFLREFRRSPGCIRCCRDHSQRQADFVLSGAMLVGVMPS